MITCCNGYETYNFKVVMEPDEDFDGNPAGGTPTVRRLRIWADRPWGETEAEALEEDQRRGSPGYREYA